MWRWPGSLSSLYLTLYLCGWQCVYLRQPSLKWILHTSQSKFKSGTCITKNKTPVRLTTLDLERVDGIENT